MKVALTQMDIIWERKEENYKKVEELTQVAFEKNADLILFPEMTCTGFSMNVSGMGEDEHRETSDFFLTLSLKYPGLAIAYGWILYGKEEKTAKNVLEIALDGKILYYYEKIHPFSFGKEGEYYEGGERITSLKLGEWNLSGFICYDLRFPELFQIASKECEFLFVIANWPNARIEHWKTLLKARAIETQSYLIGINRTGLGDGLEYIPSSLAFDPLGRDMTTEICNHEIYIVELKREEVKKIREEFPLKKDRREELYLRYYKQKNKQ